MPKMSTIKPAYPNDNSSDSRCENRLKQQFYPKAPNMVWVSDITYIKVGQYFCYLCVIIDLYSRKVIGYRLSDKADSAMVAELFIQVYEKRGCPRGLMFHSDRGCQYTSESFRKTLDRLDVMQSFSKKGYPYDNAVAESFFRYLKKEDPLRIVPK